MKKVILEKQEGVNLADINQGAIDGVGDTIQAALDFASWGGIKEAYVFETLKELYAWLAE